MMERAVTEYMHVVIMLPLDSALCRLHVAYPYLYIFSRKIPTPQNRFTTNITISTDRDLHIMDYLWGFTTKVTALFVLRAEPERQRKMLFEENFKLKRALVAERAATAEQNQKCEELQERFHQLERTDRAPLPTLLSVAAVPDQAGRTSQIQNSTDAIYDLFQQFSVEMHTLEDEITKADRADARGDMKEGEMRAKAAEELWAERFTNILEQVSRLKPTCMTSTRMTEAMPVRKVGMDRRIAASKPSADAINWVKAQSNRLRQELRDQDDRAFSGLASTCHSEWKHMSSEDKLAAIRARLYDEDPEARFKRLLNKSPTMKRPGGNQWWVAASSTHLQLLSMPLLICLALLVHFLG
ncbi:hypothetical protein OPT61_g3290 [Boeremia exigua]|uniref:Uncharacterized protein n=1 Tax=Boeremia exigua TaxID=749465 RepID=A0ACC2III5_9PLEO|nr:hypothetical protein OPT61_g3290 [Boeremia exigua]